MNDCEKMQELMSLYIDNMISDSDKKWFNEHIEKCEKCKNKVINLQFLIKNISELDTQELPNGYHEELMMRIRKVKAKKVSLLSLDWRKYLAVVAGFLFTLVTISSFGILAGSLYKEPKKTISNDLQGKSEISVLQQTATISNQKDEKIVDATSQANNQPNALTSAVAKTEYVAFDKIDEKNYRELNIVIEVSDLNGAINTIDGLTGYNSASQISYYDEENNGKFGEAYITRRVDLQNLSYVSEVLRGLGKVISEDQIQTSFTKESRDLNIYIENIEIEINRLTSLIKKSNSMDNIVYIESRLSQLTDSLDINKGRLNEINAMTSKPSINIRVYSKQPVITSVIHHQSFSSRINSALLTSALNCKKISEEIMVILSIIIAPVSFIVIFILLIYLFMRFLKSKSKR